MSSTPHISIIIPLYFCSPTLYLPIAHCLAKVKLYYPEYELIVVDDASPLELPGWPITSVNTSNLGFTATVNKGLSLATGDVLIVMNDDIILAEGQLDRFNDLKGLVIASPADTASSPDDKFGACWGMTRETYELLGPLNERYRNFFSDVEYYERAEAKDVKIIKWKDIVLSHPESSTFKLLDKETLLKEDQERYDSK